jgi:hypothetical protein
LFGGLKNATDTMDSVDEEKPFGCSAINEEVSVVRWVF